MRGKLCGQRRFGERWKRELGGLEWCGDDRRLERYGGERRLER
jgi:hypothetical protein